MKDMAETNTGIRGDLDELRRQSGKTGDFKKLGELSDVEKRDRSPNPVIGRTELQPGDHVFFLYESEEERRAFLAPFLIQGLEQSEKVSYVTDTHSADSILDYLRGYSMDIDLLISTGHLVISDVQDVYMRNRVFDPDEMIAFLRDETDKALAEGYTALRFACEMTWVLQEIEGSEQLLEYEAKLNDYLLGNKCLAFCQYDRHRFASETLLDVLHAHPIVVSGTALYENIYYIPPTVFREGDKKATKLGYQLRNLALYKQSEAELHLYSEIMTNIAEGIYLVRASDSIIVYSNPRFEEMFGYAPREMIGKHVSIVNAPAKRGSEETAVDIMSSLEKKGEWHGEIQNIKKDGTPFWCYASVSALNHHEYGRVFVSVHRDITVRKRASEKLESQNIQLEEMNIALREVMLQVEKEKDRLGNQVYANINKLIKPQLEKLKYSANEVQENVLTLMEHNLDTITSSFGFKLSSQLQSLSPREIEICNLIRQGARSKGIASLLNIAEGTVIVHRNNIRNKLGIRNTTTNLYSFLNSL
ncbi:MEDS domain-containing protein [Candidatus Neomarinimicrobiota bacterium]